MDVSVIIVNYHTCELTAACIDSVFDKTQGIDFEVLLIDNASTDGSYERFSQDSRIRYYYQQENLGFGRANNIGIGQARGRNIFFLNSDTLLLNNAVKILSDYLDACPKVGACGGNLYTQDLQPNESFLRYRPSIYEELNQLLRDVPDRLRFGRNLSFNHTGQPLKVGYITGADLMVKSEVLQKTGNFDPRFFMYYEETELCHRICRQHYEIHSLPQARIIHLSGASFKGDEASSYRRQRIKYQSKMLYLQLTHSGCYIAVDRTIRSLTIHSKLLFSRKDSHLRKRWEKIRNIEKDKAL